MFHVKQNSNLIPVVQCPICESNDLSLYMETKDYFYTQEDFTITKCNKCEFVFTNPVPKNLARYYETDEYLSHNTKDGGPIASLYSLLRSINIKRKYNLVSSFCKSGKILDIGSGSGELLNYFNTNSWETTGIEPNITARSFSKKEYSLDIYDEDKLDSLQPEYFDVISMWHVLEHVSNLNNRLMQVKRLIKENGTLIFALPNLNSPDANKYQKYWSALDVPRHLYHFTQKTFNKLLEKHDLKLIHAEPMKLDAYYVSMLSEKYKKNRFPLLTAIIGGYLSNFKARKNNNYSSMIFVVQKGK